VIGSASLPDHTSSVGADKLPFWRRSSSLESKLKGYAAGPSSNVPHLPPEVRAIFDEAKGRATALPTDAQAIALNYSRQVPPPNRENLVRLIYFTAGCAQGMDPRDAIRYAAKMWAQPPATDDESRPLAS
jgi:hypothetical protein